MAFEHPGGKRQRCDRIDENQPDIRVDQIESCQGYKEWDQQQHGRERLPCDQPGAKVPPKAETKAGECVCAERGQHNGNNCGRNNGFSLSGTTTLNRGVMNTTLRQAPASVWTVCRGVVVGTKVAVAP